MILRTSKAFRWPLARFWPRSALHEQDLLFGLAGLRTVRILRITRLVRVAKLGRILRFVMALRTLIQSIIYTLPAGIERSRSIDY